MGIAYLLAGTVAWWRRPDNLTGALLVAIACCWYIPEFQAAAEPVVARLAYATRRLVNVLSAYLLLVFPSGHLSLRRHRLATGVLLGAVVALVVFAYNVFFSILDLHTSYEGTLGVVLSVARAAVPVGFLIGLLRMKLGHTAVAGLVVGLHGDRTSADSLERSIAEALHDPARAGIWSPATRAYLDSTGRALALPQPDSGMTASFVQRNDRPLGVILHDAALRDDKALLDAVSAAFALSVDRDRLASTVHAQAEDVHKLEGSTRACPATTRCGNSTCPTCRRCSPNRTSKRGCETTPPKVYSSISRPFSVISWHGA